MNILLKKQTKGRCICTHLTLIIQNSLPNSHRCVLVLVMKVHLCTQNGKAYDHNRTAFKSNKVELAAAAAAKSLQSCLTLCDPIDGSLPGSPIPGILEARTLEWVAISFSNA